MSNELIKLDETIIAIDDLINTVPTSTEANLLFKVKDILYRQQRYIIDIRILKQDGGCRV